MGVTSPGRGLCYVVPLNLIHGYFLKLVYYSLNKKEFVNSGVTGIPSPPCECKQLSPPEETGAELDLPTESLSAKMACVVGPGATVTCGQVTLPPLSSGASNTPACSGPGEADSQSLAVAPAVNALVLEGTL